MDEAASEDGGAKTAWDLDMRNLISSKTHGSHEQHELSLHTISDISTTLVDLIAKNLNKVVELLGARAEMSLLHHKLSLTM
jgi:hypothetical protein